MVTFGAPTLIEIPSLEESLALCNELGLKFFEINMSFPRYQSELFDVEKMLALKEKYGVFYTVHIDENLDPCSVNRGISRVYTQTMLKAIELAKALDIPTLNMHTQRGIKVTLPDRVTYIYAENEELYLSDIRAFRDAVTSAIGGSGIKVCIENTGGYDLPFLRHGIDELLKSPAFMLTFDIGHDNALKNIDEPFILERGDRLIHMHMHDGLGKRVHLALGDGDMDISRFLRLADEHSCRVVLETKTVEALRKSVAYLAGSV